MIINNLEERKKHARKLRRSTFLSDKAARRYALGEGFETYKKHFCYPEDPKESATWKTQGKGLRKMIYDEWKQEDDRCQRMHDYAYVLKSKGLDYKEIFDKVVNTPESEMEKVIAKYDIKHVRDALGGTLLLGALTAGPNLFINAEKYSDATAFFLLTGLVSGTATIGFGIATVGYSIGAAKHYLASKKAYKNERLEKMR